MAQQGDVDALRDRSDETDVFVALVRTAFIIALILAPTLRLLRETPMPVRVGASIAAAYTLALFIARLAERRLPLQRPLAVGVDLLLVTVAIIAWPLLALPIFQVYYLVVFVAALWFGLGGALAAAALAIGAYLCAEAYNAQTLLSSVEVLGLLMSKGAAGLFLLAIVSTYLLRASERERERGLRLDHELRLARDMQRQMLPDELPEVEGYELAVRLEAAREVSGDLYGFLRVSEETMVVWVADVAGKGVHGMMHVSMLYSHLRAAVLEGLAPAAVAERVNRGVYDAMQPSSFASVFIAQLQLRTGRLTYTNCGHPPPLLLRGGRTDDAVPLSTATPVVGVTTMPHYRQLTTQMRPGDLLVITTDGVQEARNPEGEMFDDEGLVAALAQVSTESAAEVVTAVMHAVREFSGRVLVDDAIVAVVRRVPPNKASAAPVANQ